MGQRISRKERSKKIKELKKKNEGVTLVAGVSVGLEGMEEVTPQNTHITK